ncbi:MAG TPA: choice-of-anchor R domain-containing protein, partial [Clostridia bacterium]
KTTTIDMSNPSTSVGYCFGCSSDEVKRWQTFTVPSSTSLNSIDIKIAKFNGTTQSDATVQLYNVQNGKPTGNAIATATIPAASIGTTQTVVNVPLNYPGLVQGKQYAIVLGQSAPGYTCYVWCTGTNSSYLNENYGKADQNSVYTDETRLGSGWLKLYLYDNTPASALLDMYNNSTDVGYCFGSPADEVKRWQTFTATDLQTLKGIDLKIAKFNGTSQSDVTVQLYNVQNGLPTGTAIATATIPASSIGTTHTVLNVPIYYSGLVQGNQYAIMLGQAAPGNSCYVWCTGKNPSYPNVYFGKQNENSVTTDETQLGSGWIKLYFSSF